MNVVQKTLMRVPEVTLLFWIIKVLSTTVGETGADYLAFDLGFGMPSVTIAMSIIMSILLILQFTQFKRYVPANYWSIVVLMSILGTLITDILVDIMGVSLVHLSIIFTIMMLAGFYVWYQSEKTLSIHSIDTGKREAYYWLVILLAFSLGTGIGDLISEHFAMGYDAALILFSGLIASIALAYYLFKIDAVLAFWLAYVLTRPLGASLGDYLIQPVDQGGIGLDMLVVNLVFLTCILSMVTHLTIQHNKIQTVLSD